MQFRQVKILDHGHVMNWIARNDSVVFFKKLSADDPISWTDTPCCNPVWVHWSLVELPGVCGTPLGCVLFIDRSIEVKMGHVRKENDGIPQKRRKHVFTSKLSRSRNHVLAVHGRLPFDFVRMHMKVFHYSMKKTFTIRCQECLTVSVLNAGMTIQWRPNLLNNFSSSDGVLLPDWWHIFSVVSNAFTHQSIRFQYRTGPLKQYSTTKKRIPHKTCAVA